MSPYAVSVDLTLTLRVSVGIADTVEDAREEAVRRVSHVTQNLGKAEVGFPVLGRYVHATDAVEEGTA